jgi:2-iminobutanoate/2-iminopropanoate deaminase
VAGLVFVSGTGPHDPVTGKIVGDTIQDQTRQCLENISAILEAAGTSLERVVSVTVILLEATDFAGMNEEWIKLSGFRQTRQRVRERSYRFESPA